MTTEKAQKVLDELQEVRPEVLNDKAKRLFEAIMKIADTRDEALIENRKLKAMVDLMSEESKTHNKAWVRQYYENKAKEN